MIELKGVFKHLDSVQAVDLVAEMCYGTFYEQYVIPLTREARRLNLTLSDTIELIEGGYEEQ